MFSKQSAERFEKDRLLEDPTPGPGAYGLPAAMEASERWSDSSTNDLEKEPCHLSPLSPPCRTPTPARAVEKENRVPLSARAATPKKTPATPAPAAPATCWEGDSRRQTDLRLASRLDMVRDDLRLKSKEAKELQVALTAKDRKIEDLSKKIEELAADRREAHRRTLEAEGEVGAKRRQLHEKDQELGALQRKLEHARLARKEWTKHAEKREEEQRSVQTEMLRMQQSVDAVQDQLATSESERQLLEQTLRQQQRQNSELEAGFQAHIEVLQEQIQRETGRRRDLEERQAKEAEEREQGHLADLVASEQKCDELQGKVLKLESEIKNKISSEKSLDEQRVKLEDEVRSLRVQAEASAESLKRSEASREDLTKEVARCEELLQANAQELSSLKTLCAAMEDELQRFGEVAYLQVQQKVEEAERQLKAITEALAEERSRNKAMSDALAEERNRNQVLEQKVIDVEEQKTRSVEMERKERLRVEELESRLKELADDLSEERSRNEALEQKVLDLEEKERAARSALENERQERIRDTEICDLEARVLRAEAEAEEARQMLERWKEWGDEQQLRELAAETERLERLKQVREDVSQQVEEARKALVAENRALQKRIAELEEHGPSPAVLEASGSATRETTQVEVARPKAPLKEQKVSRSLFEEQRQQLQNRCSELEQRAKVAEKKLAEAQQAQAQKGSSEELRMAEKKIMELEEAVREAAGHIAEGNSRVVCLRWQQAVEAAVRRSYEEALKEAWAIRAQSRMK